jgi:hypothetical protein
VWFGDVDDRGDIFVQLHDSVCLGVSIAIGIPAMASSVCLLKLGGRCLPDTAIDDGKTRSESPAMHLQGFLALAALAITGCATVRVDGVRRADDPGVIEPVAFVIFQSDTPASYSQILERTISDEMQRRRIPAHFTIVSGSEKAKAGVVAEALGDVPGCIIIAPSNGSPRLNGVTAAAYYDLRALRILKHPGPAVSGSGPNGPPPINDGTGKTSTIWRGRAYARGGFSNENLGEVASQIVMKLVADHVLRATP